MNFTDVSPTVLLHLLHHGFFPYVGVGFSLASAPLQQQLSSERVQTRRRNRPRTSVVQTCCTIVY